MKNKREWALFFILCILLVGGLFAFAILLPRSAQEQSEIIAQDDDWPVMQSPQPIMYSPDQLQRRAAFLADLENLSEKYKLYLFGQEIKDFNPEEMMPVYSLCNGSLCVETTMIDPDILVIPVYMSKEQHEKIYKEWMMKKEKE